MKPVLEPELFLHFLDQSRSPYHVCQQIQSTLEEVGAKELALEKTWHLKDHSTFYIIKQDACIFCFILPYQKPKATLFLASHLDFPSLKLKPELESYTSHFSSLGVEIYGAPLLSSWFNRELTLAGKVSIQDKYGWREKILFLDEPKVFIPQLALHLDREGEQKISKQEHLTPLVSLQDPVQLPLKNLFPSARWLGWDLFLQPAEKPSFFGSKQELTASARLDNLSSCYVLKELIAQIPRLQHTLLFFLFWNHEEIGSKTALGAESSFMAELIERIFFHTELTVEERWIAQNRSCLFSLDACQGFHPNYSQKFDTHASAYLGKGIALKFQGSGKYQSDLFPLSWVRWVGEKYNIPLQNYSPHNDLSSGSTLGPILASNLGVPALDLGVPLLSMHSCREVLANQDMQDLLRLLHSLLKEEDLFLYKGGVRES